MGEEMGSKHVSAHMYVHSGYMYKLCIIDLEIFVFKNFCWGLTKTKIKNTKYFLHGESLCTSRLHHMISLRATVLRLQVLCAMASKQTLKDSEVTSAGISIGAAKLATHVQLNQAL